MKQHLPLASSTARTVDLDAERRSDEIGHWVLRLAFSRSPELRARFVKAETALFKHRFETDDAAERALFLRDLDLNWETVSTEERRVYSRQLRACMSWVRDDAFDKESWFKVPWSAVPDLVAQRRVFVRQGLAYVPQSMQISLVLQSFSVRLEAALEVCSAGNSGVS